jgi:hypothetical protein
VKKYDHLEILFLGSPGVHAGTQPPIKYLATICDIVKEPTLIGVPIPNHYLITHILISGLGAEFKKLVVVL